MIKPGQLLLVKNPDGIAVMRYNINAPMAGSYPWMTLVNIASSAYDSTVFKRIPIGEMVLCVEVIWSEFDNKELCLNASITVLWKDNIYLLFCNITDVSIVE